VILLGVTGLARAGKDHASAYLGRHMALHQYAFAESLKTMLKSVFGDHFHKGDRSEICPETCKSYRVMMQTLGTEWGREMMNPQIWVNLVARRWKEINAVPVISGMVLSDVRFDSEAEWIKLNGGVIIEIVRPDLETPGLVEKALSAVGIPGHVSEKGINRDYISHTVVNDGSLADFDIKLMGLIDQLKEG
jgi:hypothetical protein